MKNITIFFLLILFSFLGSNFTLAQKAKFKNLKVTCQKTRLPQNYVAPENRTYNLYTKGAYSHNVEVYNRGIFGWTLDSNSPKLEAVISIYGFRINPVRRTAQKREKKDKDGKVTDRWTEYTYTGSAIGKGTLYVYGEENAFKYKKKNAKKTKAELKKEAEAEEKKQDLADNPFLSSEDAAAAEDEGESDISDDSGLEGALLPLTKRIGLDVSETVKTRSYRSTSEAYKDYREIQKPKLYDFKDEYPSQAYGQAMRTLNYQYGYSPVNYQVWLQKMKSDKHPEFKNWNDACQAVETLFRTFRYNKSIESSQSKFEAIISYFNGQIENIPDNDRKGKSIKKAAFHNLANIMFYLDRHDDLAALCSKHAESKILDKPARRMLNKSDRQVALMEFHKVNSCHMDALDDIDHDDIETEEGETGDNK